MSIQPPIEGFGSVDGRGGDVGPNDRVVHNVDVEMDKEKNNAGYTVDATNPPSSSTAANGTQIHPTDPALSSSPAFMAAATTSPTSAPHKAAEQAAITSALREGGAGEGVGAKEGSEGRGGGLGGVVVHVSGSGSGGTSAGCLLVSRQGGE
jgi:hypothetical protein